MAYQLVSIANFRVPETNTALSDLGFPELDHMVQPPGLDSVSFYYAHDAPTAAAEVLLYEQSTNPWTLRHNALFGPDYGSWQAKFAPGNTPGFSVRFGVGETAHLRVSWFSGPYDASQDPANPLFTTGPFCQYGTERQPSAQLVYYLTPDLIETILTAIGFPELSIVFSFLWFSTLNIDEMCSNLPPPFPTLTLDLLTASSSVLRQLFIAAAWPFFCQCRPGTPAPIPPPTPSGTIPPGWPTPPPFDCVDTNVCAALTSLQQQLSALQQTLVPMRDLLTSVQRFKVPFGYIAGTVHQNLTGEGQFMISRLVGVQVLVQQLPPGQRVFQSSPDYFWNVGWMSISDGQGMLQQRRLARAQHTWLPDQCQDATVFGYFLEPGVSVTFVELQPEP